MKKLHEWALGAAMMLFALTACNNEAILTDVPQMNESETPDACVLLGDDFRWEGNESRTALSIEDNVAKFSWTPGDLVGILPDKGAQVYFTIPEPEAEEEVTDENRRRASFDGGAWALKAESNYAAYYPFVEDFHLDRTLVPVKYTGQKQTGTSTAHLGAYDFMGARPVTTNANGGGVTFDFDHVGALALLKFTVPEANTALKSVTLSAEGASFITEGTYDLTSTEGFSIASTATSENFVVEVDYTTIADNEEVTVYFMCAPVDLSGKTIKVSIAYGEGESASILELMADGKNLEAAGGYALIAVMGEITDPAQAVKGDFAMADGTFISKDATLSDAQKTNVRGIVFWTTAETTTEGRITPASFADDLIMATDFPNCKHGLIVSLKDVSQGTVWQSTPKNLDSWQSNTFAAENKDDYKSIVSYDDATYNVNYILGYQNTKLLKAYNEQCEEANKVIPVSLLDEFSANNPAPVHTTGWFLPSPKELHMLCYKDVDHIRNENGWENIETKTAVNASLVKVNGDLFGDDIVYWSSTMRLFSEKVYTMRFTTAQLNRASPDYGVPYVRAVCAY